MANNIVAKIQQGTRSDSTDLCRTCARCTIRQGARSSDEVRYCGVFETNLKYKVADCNGYYDANLPSLKSLYDTAWILNTDSRTRDIGFIPFNKWKQNERNQVPDEYYD